MAGTITPAGGNTPAAVQLNQGLPNASNSQAPAGQVDTNQMTGNLINGQPLSSGQAQQVSGQFSQATNQLATMQTPQARQGYIDNSNLPALQNNYEDLAKQLFELDKNVVSTNYNPITPASAPVMPTDQSPLALTMGSLASPNFSFTNPNLSISSQTASKENINDLLSSLNTTIGKEFASRKGEYASTTKSQQTYIDSLLKILELNQNLMALQNKGSGGSLSRDVAAEKAAIAKRIASSGQIGGDGKLSPTAYQSAKQMAMSEYGWSPQDFDSEFSSFVDQSHSQDYGVTLSASQLKATNTGGKRSEYVTAANNIENQIDNYDFDKLGIGTPKAISAVKKSQTPLVGGLITTGDDADIVALQGLFDSLYTTAVATLSARGATKPDLDALKSLKVNVGDSRDLIEQRIQSINSLLDKTRVGGNTGSAPKPSGPTSGGFTITEVK